MPINTKTSSYAASGTSQLQNSLETTPTSSITNSDPYGFGTTALNSSASTLVTAAAVGDIQITTPNSGVVQNRMVFSTVNEEVRAAKTFRISNTGGAALTITGLSLGSSLEKDNAVRPQDHDRAADFQILDAQPFTLAAGASKDISVRFQPQRVSSIVSDGVTHTLNGENYASLIVTSNDPDEATKTISLAGLNTANYEGNNEPALAEIARTFGWTLNVGRERNTLNLPPSGSTNVNINSNKTLLGDEVYSPYWVRADSSRDVELWQLAVYSSRRNTPHDSVEFIYKNGARTKLYELAGRDNDDSKVTGNEELGSNNLSGGENQKLLPKLLINGVNTAQTVDNVDFTPNAAFALRRGDSSTDDTKNGSQQLHNWRMYAARNAQGVIIPNTWFAAVDPSNTTDTSTGKNFDYNDNVYLLVNAKPESSALDPSVGGLFPGSPELEFYFRNQTYSGTLTDINGRQIGLTSTQLNKNDTFATSAVESYDRTKLVLDTSGTGTLKVTTTSGSNGVSDNTLMNALQTTFDGRVSNSVIGTKLLGPLNNINAGFQQAGVMFGPDQDNFIKLVAIAQSNGSLGLQFYTEEKGVATNNVSPVVPISNPGAVQSLELKLLTNPLQGTVQAAYRLVSSTGDTGTVVLPNSITLKGGQLGHYFAARSKAGIITSSKNASPITVAFDNFTITPAEPSSNRTVLRRLDVGRDLSYVNPGSLWSSDAGFFSPSDTISENAGTPRPEIKNTALDPVYQTYRAKLSTGTNPRVLSFNIPVDTTLGNLVDINLHFAEVYFTGAPGRGAAGVGKRVFDVSVEGQTLLNNFDITAAAGGALTAVVVPIQGIRVQGGELNISLRADVDYGSIAAISVLRSA